MDEVIFEEFKVPVIMNWYWIAVCPIAVSSRRWK